MYVVSGGASWMTVSSNDDDELWLNFATVERVEISPVVMNQSSDGSWWNVNVINDGIESPFVHHEIPLEYPRRLQTSRVVVVEVLCEKVLKKSEG